MCSCIWLTPPRLAFSSYLRDRPSTNYYIWLNKVVVVVVVVVGSAQIPDLNINNLIE